MKKVLIAAALTGCLFTANAQDVIERPTFGDNWQIGIDAGATTPITGHGALKHTRLIGGLHLQKQISPLFGAGVEGTWDVNTTRSANVFDRQYVGAYGMLNLTNAFCGFTCEPRAFSVDLVGGAGWIHHYIAHAPDRNDLGLKAGLNFNFGVTENFSISLKPAVLFNVTSKNRVSFARKTTDVQVLVGFNYNINPGFKCYTCPDESGKIADLNSRINQLRGDLDASAVALAASQTDNAALAAALAQCQNQPREKEVVNNLNSVRYVFFKIGSHVITADQMPNVEMIAAYLKNHPKAKVQIRGYASPDGPEEVNIRLANQRAEAVKNALIKKYKISADRISAEGQGIGHMFSEESWNRVSICTLEE